jgi:hypothetical protein
MRRTKLAGGIAAMAATTAAVVLIGATAAQAAVTVYHGDDYAFTIGADGVTVWVCDKEADNHGVYADYVTRAGRSDTINDGNGSADGCGWENSADGSFIDRIIVCERSVGCSAWGYA